MGDDCQYSYEVNHIDVFDECSDAEVEKHFSFLEEEFKDRTIVELMVKSSFDIKTKSGFDSKSSYSHSLKHLSRYEISWFLDSDRSDENLKVITIFLRDKSYMRFLSAEGLHRIPINVKTVDELIAEVRKNLYLLK